jgi:hypothetical protein
MGPGHGFADEQKRDGIVAQAKKHNRASVVSGRLNQDTEEAPAETTLEGD